MKNQKQIKNIQEDKNLLTFKNRFGNSSVDILQQQFKNNTIGLTTKQEFVRKQEHIQDMVKQNLKKQQEKQKLRIYQLKKKRHDQLKQINIISKKKKTLLTFEDENNQKEQNQQQQKQDDIFDVQTIKRKIKCYGKNPTVRTSFLPDYQRMDKIKIVQKNLRQQYQSQIQKIKQQFIQLSFSYWDGPNMVKKVRTKKKEKVLGVLEACRLELMETYQFMAKLDPHDLMFVVKDALLPHNITFYQVQALKLTTKFGEPLFNWKQIKVKKQGKQQIEILLDTGPACRIIDKSKYEKFCHLYPCNLWQKIDLSKLK